VACSRVTFTSTLPAPYLKHSGCDNRTVWRCCSYYKTYQSTNPINPKHSHTFQCTAHTCCEVSLDWNIAYRTICVL